MWCACLNFFVCISAGTLSGQLALQLASEGEATKVVCLAGLLTVIFVIFIANGDEFLLTPDFKLHSELIIPLNIPDNPHYPDNPKM